ncbi:hypothetical protein H6764_02910 [Candidatus Nomurabacteria bacterium]|nr:hypothetical protein [Candidatus Nomurabacteria bacterium]
MQLPILLNVPNLGYLFSLSLAIIIAVFLTQNSKKISSRLFVGFISSISLWILSNAIADNIGTYDGALFWSRVAIVGPVFIGPLFFIFADVFPNEDNRFNLKKFILFMTTTLPFLAVLFTKWNVESVTLKTFGIDFVPGVLYQYLGAYLGLFMISGFWRLIKKFRIAVGTAKRQIGWIFIGFSATFIIAIVFSLIFPLLGYSSVTFVGPASSLIFLICTVYVLIWHRLFGVKFIIGKTLYHGALLLFPYILFYTVYFIYSKLWGSIFTPEALLVGFLVSAAFVTVFKKYDSWLGKFVEDVIIHTNFNPQEVLSEFQKVFSKELDFNRLVSLFLDKVNETVAPKSASFILLDIESKDLKINSTIGKELFESKSEFYIAVELCAEHNSFITVDDLASLISEIPEDERLTKVRNYLLSRDIYGVFRLFSESKSIAILILGEKPNDTAYTEEEIEFILSVNQVISVALERSLLYQEVRNLNNSLQMRVEKATKELQQKYAELKQIRDKERDMIDIMGHELRTPLSIIKVSLGALDLKAQKAPEAFDYQTYKEYLPRLTDAIERESQLLETMISSTKIDAKRMEVHLEETDILPLIEDSIIGQKELVLQKGLKIIFNRPETNVKVFADKVRLGEVLDNLIGNAVKYTQKGTVTVRIADEGTFLKVSVQDTGVGIPREALSRLGEKFFRVKQHLNEGGNDVPVVRPGGTGLGLYVTFGLVELMSGKVSVESKLGEGSTFSFTIPKYTGQKIDAKTADSKDIFTRLGLKESES